MERAHALRVCAGMAQWLLQQRDPIAAQWLGTTSLRITSLATISRTLPPSFCKAVGRPTRIHGTTSSNMFVEASNLATRRSNLEGCPEDGGGAQTSSPKVHAMCMGTSCADGLGSFNASFVNWSPRPHRCQRGLQRRDDLFDNSSSALLVLT